MKPTTNAAASIDQARTALESVSRLLVDGRVQDLEACGPYLEQSARLLERGLAAMRQGQALGTVLDRFGHELWKARALHEHAGGFYGGLLRLLTPSEQAGYSPRGEEELPRLAHPGRRVSVDA